MRKGVMTLKVLVLGLALVGLLAACSSGSAPEGPQKRVVGGYDARPNQFPFSIVLHKNSRFACGGSIINSQWVLTAKHCVNGANTSSLRVTAGEHSLSRTEGTEQARSVSRIVTHSSRDLALLKLSSPLSFNASVKKIDIAGLPAVGRYFVVAGWGATNSNGTGASDTLKYYYPKRANSSICGSVSGEFCGEDTTNQNWQACYGDSGGPAFYYSGGQWRLAGAVQRASRTGSGSYCARGLAIYAALDRNWVNRTAEIKRTAYDRREGAAPDFRKLSVAYTGNLATIDIQFYNASDLAKAGHNVYLYGTHRDTVRFNPSSFSVLRDGGSDGHFEQRLASGTVRKIDSTTLRIQFNKSHMPDIDQKRVWVYSQTSRDRLPDSGHLQMR